jgi:GNAT superfamily N-acetyltransferase
MFASVRTLRSSDRALVAAIFEQLGPQSRLQRFLAPKPEVSERDLSVIMDIDGRDGGGVIALIGSPVGAAHYARTANTDVAEIAVEVADEWQRQGIGRMLVAELRALARQAGVRRFEWVAFESNRGARALAGCLNDPHHVHVGGGVFKWSAAI